MSLKLPVIKTKDFQAMLVEKGFALKEITGSHYIYVNSENCQVVLPFNGKEIKPIMAKVILNRIKRDNLQKYQPRRMPRTKGSLQ